MMRLYINTQNPKVIDVALKNGRMEDCVTDQNEYGSQVLLPLIQKLLKKNNLKIKEIKGIKVETGPGSFTGLRVGVSVANALGFALGIPVNGKKIEAELCY